MTPKQKQFIKEYLIDFNAAQAAIRAGYSKKTAKEIGSRLLTKPHIRGAVNAEIEKRAKKTDITAERILKELARVAFANMGTIATWNESGVSFTPKEQLSEDALATVQSVKETTNEHGGSLEIKQHDKLRALEMLGKHLKLFVDRTEHGLSPEMIDFIKAHDGKSTEDLVARFAELVNPKSNS